MPYEKAKIYTDGSHYIAIPHEDHPERRRKRATAADEKKEAFEIAYDENKTKKKVERTEKIVESIKDCFDTDDEAREFVAQNTERKQRNLIAKRQRLHFHALLYIPDGNEVGELKEVNDYDTVSHKRQITYQNTFFLERYGRNDFKPICKQDLGDTVGYLMKYIGKSNERLTYSRNLPQYFVSDILDKDVICGYGIEDRKLLLGDSFDCFIDGEYIGQVSPGVIAKMPKAN